jgi:hypothetical protein
MSVFGAGDYDRKKKKFQSSVWRVVDYDLKKKKFKSSVWRVVSFWCWRLRPEKKKVRVVCLAGCQFFVLAITTGKKKSSSRLSGGLGLVSSFFGRGKI